MTSIIQSFADGDAAISRAVITNIMQNRKRALRGLMNATDEKVAEFLNIYYVTLTRYEDELALEPMR